jgi:hypothetical protein
VDPEEKTVQVHILDDGHYITNMYDDKSQVPVSVLPGCVIDFPVVFAG